VYKHSIQLTVLARTLKLSHELFIGVCAEHQNAFTSAFLHAVHRSMNSMQKRVSAS